MGKRNRSAAVGEAAAGDREAGVWRGRSVAKRFTSPDGMTVLVGRSAADNDVLSLKLGAPRDFWLHVAAGSGSHVVVLNPDKLERLPRDTQRFAAGLAAYHSKLRRGGQVAVHVSTCAEIKKPRGFAAGKVTLGRYATVRVTPEDAPAMSGSEGEPSDLIQKS